MQISVHERHDLCARLLGCASHVALEFPSVSNPCFVTVRHCEGVQTLWLDGLLPDQNRGGGKTGGR